MKIGILTQPLHLNYGGILQNWALQQVLKGLGHEPVMINRCYDAPVRSAVRMAARCRSFAKHIVLKSIGRDSRALLCNPFARVYEPHWPKYADRRFCSKRINKSTALYSDYELRHWIDRCDIDAFVVGSDQVWRQEYSPRIETYFLDFLPIADKRKRIAYAASFGTNNGYIDDDKLPACRALLKHFDAVSVRENGGVNITHEVFDRKDAVKVLDPTLLLSAEDYRTIIGGASTSASPYVAAYILDDDADKTAILDTVSANLNVPAQRMSANYTGTKMPTMAQWLATCANAEAVVTDSFHGCVFSIIFGKPFIAIGNTKRGLDRFTSLLGTLGLTGRLINSLDEFNARRTTLLSPIDYAPANELLSEQRTNSIKFLTNALA